jgi:hypothetical protein
MKWHVLLVTGLGCVLGTLQAAQETKKFSYVDLKPKANQKLAGSLGTGFITLASLPEGEQTLQGVKFKIADGLIHLGRKKPPFPEPMPDRVEGIQVGKTFAKLHLLHGTQGGAYRPEQFILDDTKIAEYKVHYADGTTKTIPVVYGRDIRDWYKHDDSKVTRGKVAWEGANLLSKSDGKILRLYLSTWENPHPTKRVVSIDYVRVGETVCAPFCVAMTLEEK